MKNQNKAEITNIIEKHLGKDSLGETNEFEDAFTIQIQDPTEFQSTRYLPLSNFQSHCRNLARAMSALSVFCIDRNINVRYSSKESKFTFALK